MDVALKSPEKCHLFGSFDETRGSEELPTTFHVSVTSHPFHDAEERAQFDRSEQNLVTQLFPEFFIRHSSSDSAPESWKIVMCGNRRLDYRRNDPLIQSWLNMYGCNH